MLIKIPGLLSISLFLFFKSFAADCPPQGDGGDTTLNKLQNRTELPGSYIEMPVRAFLTSVPAVDPHPNRMDKFSPEDRAKLDSVDKVSVALEGYLIAAKQSGLEASNCHMPTRRDYRLWIASVMPPAGNKDSTLALRSRSVIVSSNPYWRQQHGDSWQPRTFTDLAKSGSKVRVSGWVMYDPEHPEQLGKIRATLWEIHPIVKIEVWINGEWREL